MDQFEARLERIERLLERLQPAEPDPIERDLIGAIAAFTGRDWFAASEVWQSVAAIDRACTATGDPAPYIVSALAEFGSARGFG